MRRITRKFYVFIVIAAILVAILNYPVEGGLILEQEVVRHSSGNRPIIFKFFYENSTIWSNASWTGGSAKICFNNGTCIRGNTDLIAGSGMTITKNAQGITFSSSGGGGGLVCNDVVCRLRTNSSTSVWQNVTFASSQYIKPVITVANAGGTIVWNLIGNFVNSITVGANTLVGALTLSGGNGISITNAGNTITVTDVNNTSIKGSPAISVSKIGNTVTIIDINNTSIIAGSGVTVSKSGNTITISSSGGGCSTCEYAYTLWKTDAVAGVAAQGLNLPVARTELDSAVGGSRMNITSTMLGGASATCTLHANVRVIAGTAGQFPRLSIRDVSSANTNVLTILRVSGITTGNIVQYNSTYVALPSWLTGATSKIVAVYLDSGNGSADYILKDVSLRCKP